MKKVYFLLILLVSLQGISAQDLASKIPASANAVAKISAGKLMQLMPAEEWDKTSLGKKLRAMREKDSSITVGSVKDLGIDLSGNMYYFHTEDDSMHYNTMLIPLSDASKMDKLLGKRELLRLANNVRKVTDEDSSGVALWNNGQLIYVNAMIKDPYFRTKEVAQRHGLSYNYYYDEAITHADSIASESATDTMWVNKHGIDSSEIIVDKATIDSILLAIENAKEDEQTLDTSVLSPTIEDEEVLTGEGSFDYYNDISIKKRLSAACASAAANELFYKTAAPASILQNASFAAANKPESVASLWVDRPMDLYYRLLPFNYFYRPGAWNSAPGSDASGYKSFSSQLTMDEKKMNLHFSLELNKETAELQEKIMDRKINKQFYKYINTDSMLGYMSWAVNTKNYLQQFPALMERTYGSMGMGMGADEYSLMGEFFSFLLDEEAIGNMIKGDMMVLFDGVYQQETTYTDYSYNDNFEQTPVVKTKQETIPRFLMMLSSEENNLAKKLVRYGLNKSVVKAVDGFYEVEVPGSPIRFYFMYKDDIFFLTNSHQNIKNISTGSFRANISKSEKKFIGDHNLSVYINPKNIGGKLAGTEVGGTESLTEMINTFNKMGTVRMKMNPLKNNTSTSDIWMDVPEGNNNALGLLLSFFEDMIK